MGGCTNHSPVKGLWKKKEARQQTDKHMDIAQVVDVVIAHLNKHPDDATTRSRLASALARLEQQGEEKEPQGGVEHRGEDDEEGPPVSVSDIRDAMSAQRYDDVVSMADTLLVDRPNSAQLLRLRGRALLHLNRCTDARDALASAQAIDFDEDVEGVLRACQRRLAPSPRSPRPTPPAAAPSATTTHANVPDPSELLNNLCNSDVLESVQRMMRDPEAMEAIRTSPLFESPTKK
mgnify:CR=1 FL=1